MRPRPGSTPATPTRAPAGFPAPLPQAGKPWPARSASGRSSRAGTTQTAASPARASVTASRPRRRAWAAGTLRASGPAWPSRSRELTAHLQDPVSSYGQRGATTNSAPRTAALAPAMTGRRNQACQPRAAMAATIRSQKRLASRLTATCAFGCRPVTRCRSTRGRPGEHTDVVPEVHPGHLPAIGRRHDHRRDDTAAFDAARAAVHGDSAPEIVRQQRRLISQDVCRIEPLPSGQLIYERLTAVDKDLHHRPVRPIAQDEEPKLKHRHVPDKTTHQQGASRCA